MSEFNRQVGKFIDKTKSEKLKANWKKTKISSESSFVGSDIINKLLNTPGSVGLRIYYGMDEEGNMQPIFFASDENGRPIKTSASASDEEFGGADATMVCPPYCPR